jgi:hypothetical protein
MTPPPIRIDWSSSLKDEIWSLRMIHQNPFELYRALLDVVEIANTMHIFLPLLYSYILAPTCFGSSLSYVKIQPDIGLYFHITQTDPEAP